MSKTITPNKQNTSATFYSSNLLTLYEAYPYSSYKRHFDSNTDTIELSAIEAQGLLQKLMQKISLDQSKIQKNYLELNEISKQIEECNSKFSSDREIDSFVKLQKQSMKQLYAQKKQMIALTHKKYYQQLQNCAQTIDIKEKQVQEERIDRDQSWSKLIDQFQKQISQLQHIFKQVRSKQEQYFEQNSVQIYNLEQQYQQKVQKQKALRVHQHEMVIRLVSECIENMKYIY